MSKANLQPIVLIGAARSGTKILRDTLAMSLGAPAVPYDVGYVWRYGNESCPHDCLNPEDIKPRTRRLVRGFITGYADSQGCVVEKTVGNTLRVPFVADLLPEAVFVHVIRDGMDVAESARREWEARHDLRYLAAKLRHFPLRLVPSYGRKFIVNATLARWRTTPNEAGGPSSTWGPRYPGMDRDLANDGLLAVVARQWRLSVEAAVRDLSRVHQQVVTTRYEDLVTNPGGVLCRVVTEFGVPLNKSRLEAASAMISRGSIGKGRQRLEDSEHALLSREMGATLRELGYDTS